MRKAQIVRETKEVNIAIKFNIDGGGEYNIDSSCDFLNHLFSVFCFHGLFDLDLKAKGDLKHHLIEDIAIALGDAFKKAISDCKGIKRFGFSYVVMETALSRAVIDISGRGFYKRDNLYDRVYPDIDYSETGGVTLQEIDNFMGRFCEHARLNLHLSTVYYPEDNGKADAHHILESIFKALGIALDQASLKDLRRKTIPSTKGIID